MPKTTKTNVSNQFKTRKITGGRRIDLQQVKKQTINTMQPKIIFASDEVKDIIYEIEYIIINELPHVRTEEEEYNILNGISNAYLQYFIKFDIVKTKDELYKKYIEPLAEEVLKENKKKREIRCKIQDLFYKLIMAKTETKEEEIKREYTKLQKDVVKYKIYDTKDDYITFIEKILSDKRDGLITSESENNITSIITKDKNKNILLERHYINDKLKEYVNYKYDSDNNLICKYKYDSNNNLIYKCKYKYDSNNNLIVEEYYDCDDIKINSFKYEYYDNSTDLKYLIELDKNDVEFCRCYYIEGNKIPEKYIECDPITQLTTKEIYFYNNTTIPKQIIYYNKQGQKIKEEFYEENGEVIQSSIEYEYDDNIQMDGEANSFFKHNVKKTIECNGYGNIKEINIFTYNNNDIETQICTIGENKNNINTIIKRYYNKNRVGGCDFVFCSKPNVNLVILFEFDGNGKYIDVILEKDNKNKFGQLPNFIENNILKIEQEANEYKAKQQELLKQKSDIIVKKSPINQEIKEELKDVAMDTISIKDTRQLPTEAQEQIGNPNKDVQNPIEIDSSNHINKNDLDMLQQTTKEHKNIMDVMSSTINGLNENESVMFQELSNIANDNTQMIQEFTNSIENIPQEKKLGN